VAFASFFPRVQRPRPMTLSSSHLAERLSSAVPQEPAFLVSAGSTPAAQRATDLTAGSSQSAKLAGAPDGSAQSHPSSDGANLAAADRLTGGGNGACTIGLLPSEPAPQLVGEQIVWAAIASTCGDQLVYQFSVGPRDGVPHIVRDFSPDNTFPWTPMQEGVYDIRVTVKSGFDSQDSSYAGVFDTVNPMVTGNDAVITPTTNPLVALYSAPPCDTGTIQVNFRALGTTEWMHTDAKPCQPGLSVNFLVAGMLPNWTYEMVHVTGHETSSSQFFTTGLPPLELAMPSFTLRQPPSAGSDLSQDMILHMLLNGSSPSTNVLATDLMGRVEWYYDSAASGLESPFATSLVLGGTLLLLDGVPYSTTLREVDLAGNLLRETNVDAVNAQLNSTARLQMTHLCRRFL